MHVLLSYDFMFRRLVHVFIQVIDSQYLLVIKESNRVLLFDLTNKSEENVSII